MPNPAFRGPRTLRALDRPNFFVEFPFIGLVDFGGLRYFYLQGSGLQNRRLPYDITNVAQFEYWLHEGCFVQTQIRANTADGGTTLINLQTPTGMSNYLTLNVNIQVVMNN